MGVEPAVGGTTCLEHSCVPRLPCVAWCLFIFRTVMTVDSLPGVFPSSLSRVRAWEAWGFYA